MSERTPRAIVGEMLESISAIQEYTAHLSEKEFVAQRLVQDAVIRRIEIPGEAANQVPVSGNPPTRSSPGTSSPACDTG
jgi:uncharacterized protein with HEPN domain